MHPWAAQMIHRACLHYGVDRDQLVIHSDNGGPMKGATLLATPQVLGIVPSFSRPRVSGDNPYSEPLVEEHEEIESHRGGSPESFREEAQSGSHGAKTVCIGWKSLIINMIACVVVARQ
jgi:transposase InsO family protein